MKRAILFTLMLLFISACGKEAEKTPTETLPPPDTTTNKEENITNNLSKIPQCTVSEIQKIVQGNSMSPLIADGSTVNVLDKYYECGNRAKKGDIVLYTYKGNKNPLIKMVRVTGNDKVEMVDGKLFINGQVMKNSVGSEYKFTDKDAKMLSLYIKNGKIPEDSFFLFGDNISNSTDSRKFGAISSSNFLGKVVFEGETNIDITEPTPETNVPASTPEAIPETNVPASTPEAIPETNVPASTTSTSSAEIVPETTTPENTSEDIIPAMPDTPTIPSAPNIPTSATPNSSASSTTPTPATETTSNN